MLKVKCSTGSCIYEHFIDLFVKDSIMGTFSTIQKYTRKTKEILRSTLTDLTKVLEHYQQWTPNFF